VVSETTRFHQIGGRCNGGLATWGARPIGHADRMISAVFDKNPVPGHPEILEILPQTGLRAL
jgi:hypothetical protein